MTAAPDDVEALREDVAALRRDFAQLLDHVKAERPGLEVAARAVCEALGIDSAKLVDALSADGQKALGSLGRTIEQRPLAAMLVAFAVGYAGSLLLRRR